MQDEETASLLYSYEVHADGSMTQEWLVSRAEWSAEITPQAKASRSCWLDLVLPEDRPLIEERTRRLLTSFESVDLTRLKHGTGKPLAAALYGRTFSDPSGLRRIVGGAAMVDPAISGTLSSDAFFAVNASAIERERERYELRMQLEAALRHVDELTAQIGLNAAILERADEELSRIAESVREIGFAGSPLLDIVPPDARPSLYRVGAMLHVRDQGRADRCEAEPFLRSLCQYAASASTGTIQLDLTIDPIELDGRAAVPLGLLLLELLFSVVERMDGLTHGTSMKISLRQNRTGRHLFVKVNGASRGLAQAVGETMPPRMEPLAAQLQGSLVLEAPDDSGRNFWVTVSFPNPE